MHIEEKLSEVHAALLSHSNSIQLFVANEYMNLVSMQSSFLFGFSLLAFAAQKGEKNHWCGPFSGKN